jgi:NADP-dependent 3-hydroxy acid dehydrogenase YdfG
MEKLNDFLPQRVSGKSVLVTGGTTGIGRATALLLAGLGADVVICGLDARHLEEALKDIRKTAKGSVHGFTADLGTEEGVKKAFEEADKRIASLDILVNNAALPFGSITEGSYADWKRIVDTNLTGYLACAAEAIKRMKAKGEGHILNIGSMSADVREETGSVYVATKAGIQGFSESLRKQVNPFGIKVTLIEPGAVDTDMQPDNPQDKKEQVEKGEMLAADDIAAAVLYVISQPKRCDVVELKVRPHLQLI